MKNLLRVISITGFALVLAGTGESIGTSFLFNTLAMVGGLIMFSGSTLTLLKMRENEEDAKWSANKRIAQTEMVSAELARMTGDGNKLVAKLK